jgi:TPR repeat protein
MGSVLSSPDDPSAAKITTVLPPKKSKLPKTINKNTSNDDDDDDLPLKSNSRSLETPILLEDDDDDDEDGHSHSFPVPTGNEYDLIDRIASELPNVIDDESSQQVQDYIEACDNGKGPMVACYSMAEYLSLFLRKHKEASLLYENTCFRPATDKSANGVAMDRGKSKAYAPACFNLAQMRMTGKGGTIFSRFDGYQLFDRGCRAGHGGSCMMQAKMLASYPGSLGKKIPYDPYKGSKLLEGVCENGDSLSCFTLATMLLRGDQVNSEADNVTPEEARGLKPVKRRKNEADRGKNAEDARIALQRDPKRAQQLLTRSCEESGHAPSCYNLAVMYTQGDEGIEKDLEKASVYQAKTEEYVEKFGGFGFGGSVA